MTKTIFLIILVIHGLIHLMGFAKAFKLAEIKELTQPISKLMGIFWLIAVLFFFITLILYLLNNEYWWLMAFISILVSQILIILCWQDAKFGSIANLIIFIVSLIAYANWNFSRTVNTEIINLFAEIDTVKNSIITEKDLKTLPEPVHKWLRKSNIIGKEKISSVRLKQKAFMKIKPDQEDWIPAVAEQYYTINDPAFIWKVNMQMISIIDITGRDIFINGKGKMKIKLFSLINVVDADGKKIDTGALQRYLGEIVFFPSAALSRNIIWESIDSLSAKATLEYKGTKDSGIFYFNEDGDFIKFSALRYMGNEPDAEKKNWIITVNKTGNFHGIRIPVELEATWQLDSKDWTWLKLQISDIEYNNPSIYNY